MKMSDIQAGQSVDLDDGFTCILRGAVLIQVDEKGELFFYCGDGKHYIDGQEDEDGNLVGIN